MKKLAISGRFLLVFGVLALMSCVGDQGTTAVSYNLRLSPIRAVEFKSDLRAFAVQNGYNFTDLSSRARQGRDYINREVENSGHENPSLVTGPEVIHVTVEPKDSGLDFLIAAMTSAKDADRVSLTMIYNKGSASERAMAERFSHSRFFRKWKQ